MTDPAQILLNLAVAGIAREAVLAPFAPPVPMPLRPGHSVMVWAILIRTGNRVATAHPVGTPPSVVLVGAAPAKMVGSAATGIASTIPLALVGAGTPPPLVPVMMVAALHITPDNAGAGRALIIAGCRVARTVRVPALLVEAATAVVQAW